MRLIISERVMSWISFVATTSPSRMTVTRSAMRKISSRRWEMNSTVTPWFFNLLITLNKMSVSALDKAEVGSSRIRIRTFFTSAFAISTIC